MKLKFTKDYTGRETAMKEYKAGAQADIPNAQALELIRLGVAREVWASIGAMYDPPKAAAAEAPTQPVREAPIIKAKKPKGKGKGKAQ